MTPYISLHNHSYFSTLQSLISPTDLVKRAKELEQPSVAITDYSSFAGLWEAFKVSKKENIKLIVGCDYYFLNSIDNKNEKLRNIVLLATNAIGYRNILLLNNAGFDNAIINPKRIIPVIDWKLLEQFSEGTICLTGDGNGVISQLINIGNMEEAEKQLLKLNDLFKDRLGIEVLANNLAINATHFGEKVNQQFTNFNLIALAQKYNIKIIPTSNSFYLKKEDSDTHDTLLAIKSMQPKYSNARLKYPSDDFYLKNGDEIQQFFARNFDKKYGEGFAKSICQNTVDFANLCEEPVWVDLKHTNPSGKELPDFPVKDEPDYQVFLEWKNKQSEELQKQKEDRLFIRYKSELKLNELISNGKIPQDKIKIYKDRVEEELDVFDFCGVSSYILCVANYTNWAHTNKLPVNFGRGSAGGSYVSYLLGIHKADSIKYGLVFERFFNKIKGANSPADIDQDFAKADRNKIIEYITNKYGKNNVVHISNVNKITPKVFVRDLARSCEIGGSREEAVKIGTAVADAIPKDIKKISKAFEDAPLFVEYAKKYPQFEKYKTIADLPRNVSTHAAGIIIGQRELTGLIPLRTDKYGEVAVEYDKDLAEENGLIKMDILGLETLDIIELTKKLIREANKEVPSIDVEEYDKKTYDLISSGNTYGVFQFGTSAGTIDLCKKIQPKSINDLAIITTIARPSSKEIREDFIKAFKGGKTNKLIHSSLNNALKDTFGFFIYDESLLMLAKDVSLWDLAEADKLRKLTKGKGKYNDKIDQWKKEFVDGALKNKIEENISNKIWNDVILPASGYTFNKSHAILYSMLSFETAYYKAHFPVEFLLANLITETNSNALNATANISKIKKEFQDLKIKILPPDINSSTMSFTVKDGKYLLTGLDALLFVGDDAVKDIIVKRPFSSFQDFMVRVSSHSVRANTIGALAASGSLDSFNISRKLIFLYCSDYRKKLQVWLKKHDPNTEQFEYPWPNEEDWTLSEKYALEKKYLGQPFICGKKQAYENFFLKTDYFTFDKIKTFNNKDRIPSIRAVIKEFFEFKIKKEGSKYFGRSMLKILCEDTNNDQLSFTVFPDTLVDFNKRLKQYKIKNKLDEGVAIHCSGIVNVYEDQLGIIVDDIFSFQQPPQVPTELKAKKVEIKKTKKDEPAKDLKQTTIDDYISNIEDDLIDSGDVEEDEYIN